MNNRLNVLKTEILFIASDFADFCLSSYIDEQKFSNLCREFMDIKKKLAEVFSVDVLSNIELSVKNANNLWQKDLIKKRSQLLQEKYLRERDYEFLRDSGGLTIWAIYSLPLLLVGLGFVSYGMLGTYCVNYFWQQRKCDRELNKLNEEIKLQIHFPQKLRELESVVLKRFTELCILRYGIDIIVDPDSAKSTLTRRFASTSPASGRGETRRLSDQYPRQLPLSTLPSPSDQRLSYNQHHSC